MDTTVNEFKKYQDIRHISKRIIEGIRAHDNIEDSVEAMVELAGAISSQDMGGYATKGDIQEVKSDIKNLEQSVDQKMKLAVSEMQASMYKLHLVTIILILGAMFKLLGKW